VPQKRARLYDILALLTVIVVVGIDQWTKSLVVKNMPLGSEQPFPILGHYFYLWHIHNTGAAFGMLAGQGGALLLTVLIMAAVAVVIYLYARIINSGSLAYKLIFGLIIGGALGNLIDRAVHSGYVVDFISFRIPELNYRFAIFNVADACISVGVILLFVMVLFSNQSNRAVAPTQERSDDSEQASDSASATHIHTAEQDAKS
jgi:signal peptidase II